MLTAISPIDGRYKEKVKFLSQYFSEFAYIKFRVFVEIEYLKDLSLFLERNPLDLTEIFHINDFTLQHAEKIKEYEKLTKHDVKAIEYFVKSLVKFEDQELVHFGLTSQDINSTANSLMLKNWLNNEYTPRLESLIEKIEYFGKRDKSIPMLARTHGQPATPTTIGSQFLVFVERLKRQFYMLKNIKLTSKFSGATGGFNAHYVAYPEKQWNIFADNFIERLGLSRSQYTTQVDHNDSFSELFDCIKRINIILLDFCKDIWHYISLNYFTLKVIKEEVGSSAMPHKVNPIDFENAEGNLGIANAIFNHLAEKLPVSRLQRDLSDSTVLRNLGVPIAHSHIAIDSIFSGLEKISLNNKQLEKDLEQNWQVVTEAYQTILRRESFPHPYEKLKEFSRGKEVTKELLHSFIESLDIAVEVKKELLKITPQNYIGLLY